MDGQLKRPLPAKKIFLLFISLIVLLAVSTSYVMAQQNVLTVQTQNLNVRLGPGLSYPVLDQAGQGQEFNILDEENEWYKVRLTDDRVGWVAKWHLDQEQPAAYENMIARVQSDFANVRQYSDEESDQLGRVEKNTELQVLYIENGWVQVQYNDRLGWIRADLVEVVEGELEVQELPNNEKQDDAIASPPADSPSPVALSQATIVIDPGHGGSDPGAVTPDFYEKQITLETAIRLAKHLQADGAQVILTRSDDSDVGLSNRAALANEYQADAFISLHYDSSKNKNEKSGTSTYYYDDQDTALAESINYYLTQNGPLENSGIRFGDFQVLRENAQPAVLLELGFLNHDYDRSIVYTEGYQSAIVDAIYQGLLHYFS